MKKNVPSGQVLLQRSSINIFALMVQFQKDDDPRTTGDGTFLTTEKRIGVIDPPPHDSNYFSNKIRFQQNYFSKVSNNHLTIVGTVWGKVLTLSKPMSAYAPPTDRDDYQKLIECITESWRMADSLYPEIDFSQYDAFVIFHAGTGRDIDLVNLLGYNPTPYDLPSLFVDSTLFAKSLNQNTFNGIPVDSGTVRIKHTIFLPETESRILPTSPPETLQLSINGLFAGMIGSFLGLPDLFDTKTGRSGIGQFGLMDGAGMFAYSGLFPPEPSAWEKIELGWVVPLTIQRSSTITLFSGNRRNNITGTIIKVPISDTEYFLLENRSRDPDDNGQTVTVVDQFGRERNIYFRKDTIGFNQYDVSAIHGSVVDVEDFDWALPGYIDSTHYYDGGGILIWHIDDRIIKQNRETNTVNATRSAKGVRLMEADGSQDIGQQYGQYTAGAGTEYGSPLDCWYKENRAPFYKNQFDGTTYPNSNSNTGAKSLIAIRNFSSRSPIMTCEVEIGIIGVTPIDKLTRSFKIGRAIAVQDSFIFLLADSLLYLLKTSGDSAVQSYKGALSTNSKAQDIAAKFLTQNILLVVSSGGSDITLQKLYDTNNDGVFESWDVSSWSLRSSEVTTTPVIFENSNSTLVLVGDSRGCLWFFDTSGVCRDSLIVAHLPITSLMVLDTMWYACAGNTVYCKTHSVVTGLQNTSCILVGLKEHGSSYLAVTTRGSNALQIYTSDLRTLRWSGVLPVDSIGAIVAGDINSDGFTEILISGGNKLVAISTNGAIAEHYPIELFDGSLFAESPLLIDCTNDDIPEIITSTSRGSIVVYNSVGNILNGYPFQVASESAQLVVGNIQNHIALCAFTENGYLTGIKIEQPCPKLETYWTQRYRNSQRINATDQPTTQIRRYSTFFPEERVYNWPNPVYGNRTYIRYYISEDADINVKIFDLAGTSVTTIKSKGYGGYDNEIVWDVTHIQSGIYFAHIEARSPQYTASKVIKIAVVK
ncbi:MAG: T9SS type A sorting domain-containing protein [Bacteroidetes bacterium]|nr:T9SS type A sorting domain-containing protein [Bacteroidota bacterium]